MARIEQLEGQQFNYLSVEKYIGNGKYLCKCLICGSDTVASTYNLKNGKKKSCGCIRWKLTAKGLKTHGDSNSRLYREFYGMHTRCYGNYSATAEKIYKNRGIKVCDEWYHNYPAFKEWAMNNGYNDNLTIDRIDNNLGYSPNNCRWITQLEQASNKRNNIYITINNETHSMSEWCRINNVSYTAANKRINQYGWDPIKAVTTQTKARNYYTKTDNWSERIIEFQGKKYNMATWSRITGLSIFSIKYRIDNGWTTEKALLTPSRRNKTQTADMLASKIDGV